MEAYTEKKFLEFLRERGITDPSTLRPDQRSGWFEQFALCVVLDHFHQTEPAPNELEALVVGGAHDNQIDAIVILLGGVVVLTEDRLDDLTGEGVGPDSVDLIFIQATTATKFDRAKMVSFGVGVQMILANDGFFPENETLSKRKALTRSILERFIDEDSSDVVVHQYFVCQGIWDSSMQAPEEQGWTGWARAQVERTGMTAGNVEVIDRKRLGQILQKLEMAEGLTRMPSQQAYAGTLPSHHFVQVPDLGPGTSGLIGFVPAPAYIGLLERPDGQGFRDEVAADNVRGFKGHAELANKRITETLLSKSRSEFFLRNNGVTLVADHVNLDLSTRLLTITNYQIVNGLQTSHILFHLKDQLRDAYDVLVPVKIAVSGDPVLRFAIAESTNLQTEVSTLDFLAATPVVRAIDRHLAAHHKNVLFERRQGQLGHLKGEDRRLIISVSDLMLAYASMILELPHVVKKSRKKIEEKVPREIFCADHPTQIYGSVASLFVRVRRRCQSPDAHGVPDFSYHCAYALRLFLAPAAVGAPNLENLAQLAEELNLAITNREAELPNLIEKAFQISKRYAEKSKTGKKNLLPLAQSTNQIRKEVISSRTA